MEEEKVSAENHLTSAAAFVEGGIQDACDDACSICLEAFCDSDPSTVTNCKHEFHLQCILEWCQRSSQCPMCWQPISLKDPNSQELLEAVEHERNVRMNPPRNRTIFHHPTLGDFELQHLPVNASESELEERIIQHLAAAAAMGRARHFSRREGGHHHHRSSAQGRPQFLVFSTNASESFGDSSNAVGDGHSSPPQVVTANSPSVQVGEDSPELITQPPTLQARQITTSMSGSSGVASNNRRASSSQTSPNNQDGAGPSDFHSFSENLKSRLTTLSTRYKDSITKSTKSWKDRLFNRSNSSSPEPSNEATNQNANTVQSIPSVSRMMDHLNIAEDDRITPTNPSIGPDNSEVPNPSERRATEEEDARAPCPAVGSTSSG